MRSEQKNSDMKLASRSGFIPFREEYLSSIIRHNNSNINGGGGTAFITATEGRKRSNSIEYKRSFSQGNGKKRIFFASYFSLESMLLLACLTASLLLLPLVLPPLPPPPFMLLLLPICIFGLLMFLAFMPSSNVRDSTYKYL